MDDMIRIAELNDFIFCPVSIYFHKLYGSMDEMVYQSKVQMDGIASHKNVDEEHYSTRKDIYMGLSVYSEKYGLIGKIDIFDKKRGALRERKKKIKRLYDGFIFQVYGQYFSLLEMGYAVHAIELYSMDDHKSYDVPLPEDNPLMFKAFEETIMKIRNFKLDMFKQNNVEKCRHFDSNYGKKFEQSDSVIIFVLSKTCRTIKYGYAKNDEGNLKIIK